MPLFDRLASVLLTVESKTTIIDQVRISFICEKTGVATKNNATIKIYNLADKTRDLINTKEAEITLKVGYRLDAGEQILFKGDIFYTRTDFIAPDLITEIELKDGGNKLRDARLNQSFEAGTGANEIMNALIKETKLTVDEISVDLKESFSNGFSVTGLVSDSLTKLLGKFGVDWSVNNGEILVTDKNKASSKEIVILNPATGLIGLPAFLVDDKNVLPDAQNPNKKIKITSLLIPSIQAKQKIKLESRVSEGVYVVDTVIHSGDTHGNEWLSDIEATSI